MFQHVCICLYVYVCVFDSRVHRAECLTPGFIKQPCNSDDTAGATGVAPACERHGVVEGHGRVRGAELVGVVVRWRRGWERGLGAVPLSDAHGSGHGGLDELMGGGALAQEGLHPPSPALVHHDHLDDLLALD